MTITFGKLFVLPTSFLIFKPLVYISTQADAMMQCTVTFRGNGKCSYNNRINESFFKQNKGLYFYHTLRIFIVFNILCNCRHVAAINAYCLSLVKNYKYVYWQHLQPLSTVIRYIKEIIKHRF